MSWLEVTIWWYIVLLIVGTIFIPTTRLILGKFFDIGYPFAKIVGILVLTYSTFVLSTIHVLPFKTSGILVLIAVFIIINLWLYRKTPINLSNSQLSIILIEECLFFFAILFWAYVRGQEPSIRGLEKFMDFGFINSILRTDYLPPNDMWLAGHSINYYYFGHLMGALITKLSHVSSSISYNLILASIFALGLTQTFSLCFNITLAFFKRLRLAIVAAFLGLFLVNLGGNLHTIYSFTQGYPNDKPAAPWTFNNPRFGCFGTSSSGQQKWTPFCPEKYWYPNATRFIPFTIHEFPLYSYVVADLHGHVFGIPIVLLTLAVMFIVFTKNSEVKTSLSTKTPSAKRKVQNYSLKLKTNLTNLTQLQLITTILLGFLTAINYMTNAFDGPIYMLLSFVILFSLFKLTFRLLVHFILLLVSFVIFSLPFSLNFHPFVTGIGVNCAPANLVAIGKIGPFIFERGNCQISPWWMLIILWGFFWFNFFYLLLHIYRTSHSQTYSKEQSVIMRFVTLVFSYGTFLIIVPEFFYIKDIYPAHFRANTMFKLGYQAFIMMGIISSFVFVLYKKTFKRDLLHISYIVLFIFMFVLVAIYPAFAITSYYGKIEKTPQLNGTLWADTTFPEYKEIIDYLNANVKEQPTILEAQGDSYTDYNMVSSYTGLPTVAGWLVHQWLWRRNPKVVSDIAPDIQQIYETENSETAKRLLKKHNVRYIIVGRNEREKYKNINEVKFNQIGEKIFQSTKGNGVLYEIK